MNQRESKGKAHTFVLVFQMAPIEAQEWSAARKLRCRCTIAEEQLIESRIRHLADNCNGARVGLFDFTAIIGKIAISSLMSSVDDAHGGISSSQGGGVRDFGAQLTLDICLDVDRAVFGLFA